MEYILNLINRMNPYVRRAWDGRLPVGWDLPKRIIFDFEIVYIMEGNAIVTIEDRVHEANPGDVFFFRPLIAHSMQSVHNCVLRQPHIHFDFFYQLDSEEVYIPVWPVTSLNEDHIFMREDITGPSLLDIPDKIKIRNISAFEDLLFKIIREEQSNTLHSLILKKAYLLNLIAMILMEVPDFYNDYAEKTYLNPDIITHMEKARAYMMQHFNQNISLDEISKVAGFSKSYFCKLFKDFYNTSPVQYHADFRIERAKHLLIFTNKSITDISNELGFENIQLFSRVFKNSVSISPSQYRSITPLK